MSDGWWIGLISILAWLALLVVGLRRRAMPRAAAMRYGGIWAAALGLLFLLALAIEGRI